MSSTALLPEYANLVHYIRQQFLSAGVPKILWNYLHEVDEDSELFRILGEELVDLHFDAIAVVIANRLATAGIRTEHDVTLFARRQELAFLSAKTGISKRWLRTLLQNNSNGDPVQEISVLVVEDNRELRNFLKTSLTFEDDIEIVGEAKTAAEALVKAKERKPDVILLDVNLPKMSGYEVLSALEATQPDTKVIILTAFDDTTQAMQAFQAGARGYVSKDLTSLIVKAIRHVARGYYVYKEQVSKTRNIQTWFSGVTRQTMLLTKLELKTLSLLRRGWTMEQIAIEEGISHSIVKSRIANIVNKLHVIDIREAIAFAKSHGW